MLRAKLRLSAIAGANMMSSSSLSSSKLLKNAILFSSSSSPKLFNGVFSPGNRVSFSARFTPASLRCYASSSRIDRIQVQNPIVEMDGLFSKTHSQFVGSSYMFSFTFSIIFFFFGFKIRWWDDKDYMDNDKRQSMSFNSMCTFYCFDLGLDRTTLMFDSLDLFFFGWFLCVCSLFFLIWIWI